MKITRSCCTTLVFTVLATCFSWTFLSQSNAQPAGAPLAVVQNVQGSAQKALEKGNSPQGLTLGSVVSNGDTVATNGDSKLFLRWQTGMLASLGQRSEVSLNLTEGPSPIENLGVTKGILRITKRSGGGDVSPYVVTTPEATIAPAQYDTPVDFIVDLSGPSARIMVLTGPVKVKNLPGSNSVELMVRDCQTASVGHGRGLPKILTSNSGEVGKLVAATTMPGMRTASACPVPAWLY